MMNNITVEMSFKLLTLLYKISRNLSFPKMRLEARLLMHTLVACDQ